MDATRTLAEEQAGDERELLSYRIGDDDSKALTEWTESLLATTGHLPFDWFFESTRYLVLDDRAEALGRFDCINDRRSVDATIKELQDSRTPEEWKLYWAEHDAELAAYELLPDSAKTYYNGPGGDFPEADADYWRCFADEVNKLTGVLISGDPDSDFDFLHDKFDSAREANHKARTDAEIGKHYIHFRDGHEAEAAELLGREHAIENILELFTRVEDRDDALKACCDWLYRTYGSSPDEIRYHESRRHEISLSPYAERVEREQKQIAELARLQAQVKQWRQEDTETTQQSWQATVLPLGSLSVVDRARRYLAKVPPTVCGTSSCHDRTFDTARILVFGFDLPLDVARGLLVEWCAGSKHVWTDSELDHKIKDADGLPFDKPRGWLLNETTPQTSTVDISGLAQSRTVVASAPPMPLLWRSARRLITDYPELRKPVIEGLLRAGEVLNVISVPKIGKTWLIHDLCISLAAGKPWLSKFGTVRGNVLLIDNELHSESLANRLPQVATARGIDPDEYIDRLSVANLRGGLIDLKELAGKLSTIKPGEFDLVVLDAFYRFLPDGSDENSNSDVTQLYNLLDVIAARSGVAIVCVHHSSKGSQAGKAVTDTGSGAGAQSRAADSHMVLRQHETAGAVVVDAVTRSWPPPKPFCLRWSLPTFELATDLDPNALKSDRPARRKPEKPAPWTTDRFVEQFLNDQPRHRLALIDDAAELGITDRKAASLLKAAIVQAKAFDWGKEMLANRPLPQSAEVKAMTDPKRSKVKALLAEEPELSNAKISVRCECSKEFVRLIRHELSERQPAMNGNSLPVVAGRLPVVAATHCRS